MTCDEKLVPSGDSEEDAKRNSGEENREFFQGAVTRQYEAHQCIGIHNFLLGGKGSALTSQRHRSEGGRSGPSDGMCNSPGTGRFKEISQGRAYNARIAAQSVVNFVVAGSIAIAEPINSKFRRLPEGQVPQWADHYRTLWRCFHAVRNLAALAALAFLAAAAVVQN